MANPHKGEVSVIVGGSVHTLLFDINALCAVEEALDIGIADLGTVLASGVRLNTILTLLHAGLLHHHGLSREAVGAMLRTEEIAAAGEKVSEALQAAFPTPEGGAATPSPRKAAKPRDRAGTGKRS